MKNLDLKNVQELNYDELRQIDGGFLGWGACLKWAIGLGFAAGSAYTISQLSA